MVSIIIVRFGFLEMKPALATFFGALGCAGLSILVGLAAFAAIWQNGSRGMSRILLAFLIDARDPRLSRLSRPAIPQAAGDPRHHHRPDRPAALRGAGAAAHRRRRQHRRLCRPLFGRAAAAGLSRYRAGASSRSRSQRAYDDRAAAGQQAQMAGHRRARAAAAAPRSAASRRWRARRSWDSARTSRSASCPTARIRASISAPSSRYFESDLGSNAARVTKLIDDLNTAAEPTHSSR